MIRNLLRTAHRQICFFFLTIVLGFPGRFWPQTQAQPATSAGTVVNNVRDFGATGDGQSDDSSAWQTALERGDVFCPPGVYVIGKTIAVPSNRHIWGSLD